MKTTYESTKNWDKSSFVRNFMKGIRELTECFEKHQQVLTAADTLQKVKLLESKQVSGDKRRLGLAIRQHLKVCIDLGLPPNMLSWVATRSLGFNVETKKCHPCMDLSAAGVVSVDPPHKASFFDTDTGLLNNGHAAGVEKFILALDDKIVGTVQKLRKFMNKDGDGCHTSMQLMKVAGTPAAEMTSWWPRNFKYKGKHVRLDSDTKSVGTPWLLASKRWGVRIGQDQIPFAGLPFWLYQHIGSVTIVAVPWSAIEAAGSSPSNFEGYVNSLSTADCGKWLDKHAIWCHIPTNTAFWLPPAWHAVIITTSSSEVESVTTCIPFLSTDVVMGVPADMRKLLLKYVDDWVESRKTDKPISSMAPSWSKWMALFPRST